MHRLTFSLHGVEFPLHTLTFPLQRVKFPLHRLTILLHRIRIPLHRLTFLLHGVKFPLHTLTFPLQGIKFPLHRLTILLHRVKIPLHGLRSYYIRLNSRYIGLRFHYMELFLADTQAHVPSQCLWPPGIMNIACPPLPSQAGTKKKISH